MSEARSDIAAADKDAAPGLLVAGLRMKADAPSAADPAAGLDTAERNALMDPLGGGRGIGLAARERKAERPPEPSPDQSGDQLPKPPSADSDLSVSARNRANNNPGNMKDGHGGWLSFPTPEAGMQAIDQWLVRAQNVHGLTTVRQLIDDQYHGYAPSADPGNKGKYLPEAAARVLGVDPDKPINMNDPALRQKMVGAILMQEQGGPIEEGSRDWGGRLAEESRANTAAELKRIEADRARFMSEADKEAPGSARRMEMLEEAHQASRRATAMYEKQITTPPIYHPTDVFAGFGGIVMALAALAGGRSAQPLTASLNGMAGAMEGMNTANHEAFDREFKIWDKQTSYGLKLVEVHNQEIREILEEQHIAESERQAKLMTAYKVFEMDREAGAAAAGDIQLQWQHQDQRERLAQSARDHQDNILHWYDEIQERRADRESREKNERDRLNQQREMYGMPPVPESGTAAPSEPAPFLRPGTDEKLAGAQDISLAAFDLGEPGPPGQTREAPDKWEGMPDKPPPGVRPEIWSGALTYVQTGKMPSLGMAPGIRNQIVQQVPNAQKALGIKPSEMSQRWAEYGAQTHAEYGLGTRLAALATGISETQHSAAAVVQTSEGVPRTEFGPAFNRWINGVALQTGDPKIVRFQAALNTFLNTYARSIDPSGRLTDARQKHAYETLDTAMAKGQIKAGVDQLLLELTYMKEGLRDAVKSIHGLVVPGEESDTPGIPGGMPDQGGEIQYDQTGQRIGQ